MGPEERRGSGPTGPGVSPGKAKDRGDGSAWTEARTVPTKKE